MVNPGDYPRFCDCLFEFYTYCNKESIYNCYYTYLAYLKA